MTEKDLDEFEKEFGFKKSGGNSRLLVAEMKARLQGSLDTLYVWKINTLTQEHAYITSIII